ncbi:MAG: hypothetical protein LAT50_17515 [Ectothiorhodospiraceae bacterium]|nr:hypothetical protein [Ectothiorhodospiraceae bacterium]
MTQLINLESYIDCCQYALLCGEDLTSLIPPPQTNVLPLSYRDFCKRHGDREFLEIPSLVSQLPSQPTPRPDPELPKHRLGLTLDDKKSERVMVIRKANIFSLRSLQSSYLYSDIYHYWNYASQLQEYSQAGKPIIIYNLDNFTPPQLYPLTFESRPNAPYPIPIIDPRQDLPIRLSMSHEKIYDRICLGLADIVCDRLSVPAELEEIVTYLKQINIFKIVTQRSRDHELSFIVKIKEKFYKSVLPMSEIYQVVYDVLPLEEINQNARNYSDYQFVFISPYNTLPNLQDRLTSLKIIDLNRAEFHKNWKKKKENAFPFYGQHLDQISFFVKRQSQETEIKLPDRICYEGEQEVVVYAEYTTTDSKLRQEFPLSTPFVELPFRINGEDYTDHDCQQVYRIENPFFDKTPNLQVKIRFRLKPGLEPKLEVVDHKNRVLISQLADKVEELLGFVKFESIKKFREQKTQSALQNIESSNSQFKSKLEDSMQNLCDEILPSLHETDMTVQRFNKIKHASRNVKNILSSNTGDDTLMILDDVSSQLKYKHFADQVKQLFYKAKRKISQFNRPHRTIIRQTLEELLLVIGKSYASTKDVSISFLTENNTIIYDRQLNPKGLISFDIYWRSLARISCSSEKYTQYFMVFNETDRCRHKKLYMENIYMWGYARILLWYVDFADSRGIDYQQHFRLILEHLNQEYDVSHRSNQDYLRNALFALIYLLTFRENDPEFVKPGSSEYQLGKQLCSKLEGYPILSRRANIDDMSLNEFFGILLDGKATQEQASQMIQLD